MQTMSASTREPAFSVRDLCLTAMFTALMAVFSWITIPAPAPLVPFTMQTFGVFITLELLGGKRGFFAVLSFILLAAAGAPVLSGFSGGMGVILGSTGGYILGFLITAGIYWLTELLNGKALWIRITALVTGLILCYLFGTLWFMVVYARSNAAIGIGTALLWCVVPYLLPDTAKLLLAVGLSNAVKKRVSL
jgi:biotin transport system substrate-specific component